MSKLNTNTLFFTLFATLLALASLTTSCKKKNFLPNNGNLAFSKDTVVFDTIFTTMGSTTQQLKVYNTTNSTLNIEEVRLMGGENSVFRVNFDGISGTRFVNTEIESRDSLFLFIEVTLNVNGQSLPMVVEDSILFKANGKEQYIILAAWGQDMYYHYSNLSGSSSGWDLNEGVWANDKPHVIYGAAFIDSARQLTIPAGTRVHLHKGAYLFNYKGTLNIEGTAANPVIIQGDRLESFYSDVPGQYYGVYFKEARPSTFEHVIIKNGTTGIHIEGADPSNGTNPTLTINNSMVYSHAYYGILNFAGGRVKGENTVIAKNGIHAYMNLAGSGFDFNHCTFLSLGQGTNQAAAVGISDYYASSQQTLVTDITGRITNSIIYGNSDYELAIDVDNIGTNNFLFDNNFIYNVNPLTGYGVTANNTWYINPKIKNQAEFDFSLLPDSPCKDAGSLSYPTFNNQDITGFNRGSFPDLGAYEIQ